MIAGYYSVRLGWKIINRRDTIIVKNRGVNDGYSFGRGNDIISDVNYVRSGSYGGHDVSEVGE